MRLTYKQKQELAEKYMKDKSMSFGNSVADEAAKQMFIDAWLTLLKTTWEYQFEYLKNQNK